MTIHAANVQIDHFHILEN
uniref:Uncharacterized protein n=1 Tax=Arundo donax TaxID=35708 RepID=A0A0A9EDR8_ARUDO